MSSAVRLSISLRGTKCTNSPLRNSARLGEDGGYAPKSWRARSVASLSCPANTVYTRLGLVAFCSAKRTPGRIFPAAHPQTELTTTSAVPLLSDSAASTSAAVRNSCAPARVSSSRMGIIRISGYILAPVGEGLVVFVLMLLASERKQPAADRTQLSAGTLFRRLNCLLTRPPPPFIVALQS